MVSRREEEQVIQATALFEIEVKAGWMNQLLPPGEAEEGSVEDGGGGRSGSREVKCGCRSEVRMVEEVLPSSASTSGVASLYLSCSAIMPAICYHAVRFL